MAPDPNFLSDRDERIARAYYGPRARSIRETLAQIIGPNGPPRSTAPPARRDGLGLRGEAVRRGAHSVAGGPPTALVEKDGLLFWRYADGTYLPAPKDAAVKVLTEAQSNRPSTTLGVGKQQAPGSFVPTPADPAALNPDDVKGRVLAALDTSGVGMVVGDWSGLHRFPRRADHPAVVGTQQHGYRPQLDVGSLGDIARDPRIPRQ